MVIWLNDKSQQISGMVNKTQMKESQKDVKSIDIYHSTTLE